MDCLIDATIKDWMLYEPGAVNIPEAHRTEYTMLLERDPQTNQLYLSVVSKDDPAFGLEVGFEINKGVPFLHIGNVVGGDVVAHVCCKPDGVYFVPDSSQDHVEFRPSSEIYDGDTNSSAFIEHQCDDYR